MFLCTLNCWSPQRMTASQKNPPWRSSSSTRNTRLCGEKREMLDENLDLHSMAGFAERGSVHTGASLLHRVGVTAPELLTATKYANFPKSTGKQREIYPKFVKQVWIKVTQGSRIKCHVLHVSWKRCVKVTQLSRNKCHVLHMSWKLSVKVIQESRNKCHVLHVSWKLCGFMH